MKIILMEVTMKQKKRQQRLTPGETIRAYCIHCTGGSFQAVKDCDATDPEYHACSFHKYRLGKGRPSVKLIRKFCLQCAGGNRVLVEDCEINDCPCHPFRMGKNPAYEGKGRSAEELRKILPKNRGLVSNLSFDFGQTPLPPTPTITRIEKMDLRE